MSRAVLLSSEAWADLAALDRSVAMRVMAAINRFATTNGYQLPEIASLMLMMLTGPL